MADPAHILASYIKALGLHATVTVARGSQSVTTAARIYGEAPKDLATGIAQYDRTAIILASDLASAGWSPLLDRGDQILFDGTVVTVMSCAPRVVLNTTIAFDAKLEG